MSAENGTSVDIPPDDIEDRNNKMPVSENSHHCVHINSARVSIGGWLTSIGRRIPVVSSFVRAVNRWSYNIGVTWFFEFMIKILLQFVLKASCWCLMIDLNFDKDRRVDRDYNDSVRMEYGEMKPLNDMNFVNEQLRSENKRMRDEKVSLQEKMQNMEYDISHLKSENSAFKVDNQKLRVSIDQLQREKNNLLQEKENALTRLRDSIDQLQREKHNLLQEKENALTRLSEIAGSKLKYNNPGITDLSDDNRPNKLAEKFSELYDNEWTEAFEILEKDGRQEVEIIQTLLQLLQFVYSRCKELAENQRKELTANVVNVDITCIMKSMGDGQDTAKANVQILKKISDLQKDTAAAIIPSVVQLLQEEASQDFQSVISQCPAYFTKCVTLSWLMGVQEPPVILVFDCPLGSKVDAEMFRHYTKTGTVVQYLVWPAMLLHEKGPLLLKGVFQPQ